MPSQCAGRWGFRTYRALEYNQQDDAYNTEVNYFYRDWAYRSVKTI